MVEKLFAVRDVKVSSFEALNIQQNEIQAMRAFSVAASDENTKIGRFPEDFQLYLLAEVDTVTGVVVPVEPPKFLISAVDAVRSSHKKEG